MGRVTNRVDPATLDALLARPPRATLAYEREGGVELMPVAHRRDGARHHVGFARGGEVAGPAPGARASLVVDDGWSWFNLRAITARGTLAAAPEHLARDRADLAWYELGPDRITAWDYGTLHEEPET
jgi:hypothetical protein